MKTAVSIPDPIFQNAEELAHKLGLSRSALYAKALAEFLKQAKSDELTARINEVCKQVDTRLDPAWAAVQAATLTREPW